MEVLLPWLKNRPKCPDPTGFPSSVWHNENWGGFGTCDIWWFRFCSSTTWKTWRELVARKTPWKVTGEPKGKDPTIQASFFRGEPLNFGGVYTVQTLEDLYLKSIGSHGVPVGLSWNPCAISAWIYDSYCCWTVVCMLTFHLQNTIFLLMEWCSYLGFSEFQH